MYRIRMESTINILIYMYICIFIDKQMNICNMIYMYSIEYSKYTKIYHNK